MARTVEVKDGNGNVVAQAELEDHVNVTRLMAKLDRRRQQRNLLALTIRNHASDKQGTNWVCSCSTAEIPVVFPSRLAWAAHVSAMIIPAAT